MIADLELERELLQCAIVGGDYDSDNESFAPLACLPPDAFHFPPHRMIFAEMQRQFDRGEVICRRSLRGRHDEIGVPEAELARVWNWADCGIPNRPMAEQFARRLLELHAKRRIAAGCEGLVDQRASLEETHARLAELGEVAESAAPRVEALDGKQLAKELARILSDADDVSRPVPTGLAPIDALLNGGMGRGHLVVVGAVTGGGKTLFMTNVAARALESGHVVAYASQELTLHDMLRRLTGVLSSSVVVRGIEPHPRAKEVEGFLSFVGKRFRMSSLRMNVAQVAQFARLQARSNGRLDLLVVDHIQITPSDIEAPTRQRELAHVAERLSALAKELDCVVLTGSQLTNSKGEVAMSDNTRESKDIAHNARLILEMRWLPDVPRGIDIILDKNTMGPSGESARFQLGAGLVLHPMDSDEARAERNTNRPQQRAMKGVRV